MANQSMDAVDPAERETVLLLDGFYLLFRAFNAVPDTFSTSAGEPTNAIYGFASVLLKTIADLRPEYVVVAFDSPGPTFRHEEYPEYKANRPPMDETLSVQIPRVRQLVEAFGFPICAAERAEADDVIGSLAVKAAEAGLDAAIVSGDMDLLQLVDEHIYVVWPGRRISDYTIYDRAKVQERYELVPEQVPDFKALAGDSSDNIKGLRGVGKKTAVRWLREWDTVDKVVAHASELPVRFQSVVAESAEQIRRDLRLATIRRDVPCDLDLDRARVRTYKRDRVVTLFRELEFRSLLRQLPEYESAAPQPSLLSDGDAAPTPAEVSIDVITEPGEIAESAERLAATGTLVIHPIATHRPGADPDLGGLALAGATSDVAPVFVPLAEADVSHVEAVVDALREVSEDPEVPKVGHDAKRAIALLARHGVTLRGLADDTMIAAYLVSPASRSLSVKDLVLDQMGDELTDPSILIPRRKSWSAVSPSVLAQAAGAEAVRLPLVASLLREQLAERVLLDLYLDVELPLLPVLADIESAGVALDTAYLAEMSRRLGAKIVAIEQGIYDDVGHEFKVNSPQQLGRVLADELHLPLTKRTKTGFSTDAGVLQELVRAHPVIPKVLDYRQFTKLKSTYVDALPILVNPRTHRLHTSFNQAVAATGRLSSADPNLQNIPVRTEEGRRIRRAFMIGREGWLLLAADYAQIELRIAAHLSGDPLLLQAFRDGVDVHAATAATLFDTTSDAVSEDQRRLAKTINFAILYGMRGWGLAQRTEMSLEEAGPFVERYRSRYPGIDSYIERTVEHAKEYNWVETPMRRRRYLPELNSRSAPVRAAGERMAINHPIQGGQADLIKVAMIDIHRDLKEAGLQSRMILQVHDELVFEVPEDELPRVAPLVKERMETAMSLDVPIVVEMKTGRNWDELSPLSASASHA
ncbi:MAG: DNA polymerase I [Dehalococcoidia bacterium]|nr:DNA polymerase I [Dehalococcoidia bacterium]